MGTTTRGYVYPDSTSDTQIWAHMQTLADDIDADVQTVSDAQKIDAGFAQLTADSSTFGSTESGALLTVNCDFVNGYEYIITANMNVSVDVAGDSFLMRIRADNATGTQLVGRQASAATTSTVGYNLMMQCKVTATATGTKTYVVTGV